MYHHIDSDDKALSNPLALFKEHLLYIKQNYNVVLDPSELQSDRLNVMLTFDDAYFDFYHYVYPLLQELDLKALLAVPTAYILQNTRKEAVTRLSLKHNDMEENAEEYAPFCTYEELREMQQSLHVKIASHSHNHVNLTEEDCDVSYELTHSKQLLEKNLGIKIEDFVLPFGKYNDDVITKVKRNYKRVYRIGNALNKDFSGIKGLIYRVKGDELQSKDTLFSFSNMLRYHCKYFTKRYL
jgi:peptidoglycan/xylan/chitin deacetylase (PgdA/CDA1 family)